jgi:phosphatidylinositol dimannoside acyltransferase
VTAPSALGATQAVADAFAADIAEHPADWHMLQPLWLADVPARRPANRDRAARDRAARDRADPDRADPDMADRDSAPLDKERVE